jgi:hypothetical protein
MTFPRRRNPLLLLLGKTIADLPEGDLPEQDPQGLLGDLDSFDEQRVGWDRDLQSPLSLSLARHLDGVLRTMWRCVLAAIWVEGGLWVV